MRRFVRAVVALTGLSAVGCPSTATSGRDASKVQAGRDASKVQAGKDAGQDVTGARAVAPPSNASSTAANEGSASATKDLEVHLVGQGETFAVALFDLGDSALAFLGVSASGAVRKPLLFQERAVRDAPELMPGLAPISTSDNALGRYGLGKVYGRWPHITVEYADPSSTWYTQTFDGKRWSQQQPAVKRPCEPKYWSRTNSHGETLTLVQPCREQTGPKHWHLMHETASATRSFPLPPSPVSRYKYSDDTFEPVVAWRADRLFVFDSYLGSGYAAEFKDGTWSTEPMPWSEDGGLVDSYTIDAEATLTLAQIHISTKAPAEIWQRTFRGNWQQVTLRRKDASGRARLPTGPRAVVASAGDELIVALDTDLYWTGSPVSEVFSAQFETAQATRQQDPPTRRANRISIHSTTASDSAKHSRHGSAVSAWSSCQLCSMHSSTRLERSCAVERFGGGGAVGG